MGFDTQLPMSWQPAHDRGNTGLVPYEFSQSFGWRPIERCSIVLSFDEINVATSVGSSVAS
jgi:hypothetical protein